MKTQFDIPEMCTAYREQLNYKIINQNQDNQLCIIYFSSNGLYYPNTSEVFQKTILTDNRFEWEKNILPSARKVILLRDITKQWYWNGINTTLNSIEKVADFLHAETTGMEVTCVGSSAGGYAAVLFGYLLGASRVFAFSGQFSLKGSLTNEQIPLNPTIVKLHSMPEFSNYFELMDSVKQGATPVFYFYPALSEMDIEQADFVKSFENIYPFGFALSIHGETCYPINFLNLFSMPTNSLIALSQHYAQKLIRPICFSMRVSGLLSTIIYVVNRKFKNIKNSRFVLFGIAGKPQSPT